MSHLNGFGKLLAIQLKLCIDCDVIEQSMTDLVRPVFHVGLIGISLPEASRGGLMLKQWMRYAIIIYIEFSAKYLPGHNLRRAI